MGKCGDERGTKGQGKIQWLCLLEHGGSDGCMLNLSEYGRSIHFYSFRFCIYYLQYVEDLKP